MHWFHPTVYVPSFLTFLSVILSLSMPLWALTRSPISCWVRVPSAISNFPATCARCAAGKILTNQKITQSCIRKKWQDCHVITNTTKYTKKKKQLTISSQQNTHLTSCTTTCHCLCRGKNDMMWCIVIYVLVMISNNYDHRNFQLYTLRREEVG